MLSEFAGVRKRMRPPTQDKASLGFRLIARGFRFDHAVENVHDSDCNSLVARRDVGTIRAR